MTRNAHDQVRCIHGDRRRESRFGTLAADRLDFPAAPMTSPP